MACRHDDIAMYENDITVLGEAINIAQDIIDYQILIDDSVDTLKSCYAGTVNPPDTLGTEFDNIHDGAILNARTVKTQLEGALRTARELLESAREEDEAYHAAENNR